MRIGGRLSPLDYIKAIKLLGSGNHLLDKKPLAFFSQAPATTQFVIDDVREVVYASGDVTLNRAWIPPLYLTWD